MASHRLPVVLFLLVAALAFGLWRPGTEGNSGPTLTWLVASSTADAAEEVAELYRNRTGTAIRVAAGSSNALASQIRAGAPADLFLAANILWADTVSSQGRVLKQVNLLGNRLVLIVPRGNPAGIMTPANLEGESLRRCALAGENVPAGIYAGQTLARAGLLAPLTMSGRMVRGHTARLTLGYVETGEAEAGIVYATDARASDRVEVVHRFSATDHDPIVYPLQLLSGPGEREEARRFFDFLLADEVRVVFGRHGFQVSDSGVTP